jgi:hypothetical protein
VGVVAAEPVAAHIAHPHIIASIRQLQGQRLAGPQQQPPSTAVHEGMLQQDWWAATWLALLLLVVVVVEVVLLGGRRLITATAAAGRGGVDGGQHMSADIPGPQHTSCSVLLLLLLLLLVVKVVVLLLLVLLVLLVLLLPAWYAEAPQYESIFSDGEMLLQGITVWHNQSCDKWQRHM